MEFQTCRISTVVRYTDRRSGSGGIGHALFEYTCVLPYVPRQGDLLFLDTEDRGDPPAIGIRVRAVRWSLRRPEVIEVHGEEHVFLGREGLAAMLDDQISFRQILGLVRVGFTCHDDGDLLETCREMEEEWQASRDQPIEDDAGEESEEVKPG